MNVEGLDRLLAKLDALGGNAEKAVHGGLMKSGKLVQGAAKMLCPVDTGQLRNSIEVKSLSVDTVAVGTNVEHAAYVEFGTGQRGDPAVAHRQDWPGMPPQPFLGPALEESREKVGKIMGDAVKEAIRGAGGSG